MEPQHQERRLTTILSADIVGYCHLMAAVRKELDQEYEVQTGLASKLLVGSPQAKFLEVLGLDHKISGYS